MLSERTREICIFNFVELRAEIRTIRCFVLCSAGLRSNRNMNGCAIRDALQWQDALEKHVQARGQRDKGSRTKIRSTVFFFFFCYFPSRRVSNAVNERDYKILVKKNFNTLSTYTYTCNVFVKKKKKQFLRLFPEKIWHFVVRCTFVAP